MAGAEVTATSRDGSTGAMLDVTDPASHAAFAGTLGGRAVDLLVCNAGVNVKKKAIDFSPAEFDTVIGGNLRAYFLCAQAAVKEFRRRGRRPQVSRALGKIICMSSVHDVTSDPR